MTFDKRSLKYSAVTFSTGDKLMSITEQTLSLIKQAGGSFNLPSNKILVKICSASLNPLELVLYNYLNRLFSFYNNQQGLERDYSGTIVAIGEFATSKTNFSIGDDICGMYTYILGNNTVSEYVKYKKKRKREFSENDVIECGLLLVMILIIKICLYK